MEYNNQYMIKRRSSLFSNKRKKNQTPLPPLENPYKRIRLMKSREKIEDYNDSNNKVLNPSNYRASDSM